MRAFTTLFALFSAAAVLAAPLDSTNACCCCDSEAQQFTCTYTILASECMCAAVHCPADSPKVYVDTPASAPKEIASVPAIRSEEADSEESCCICDPRRNGEKICNVKNSDNCVSESMQCPVGRPNTHAPALKEAEDIEGEAMVSCCVCDLKLGEKVCSMKKANQCITTAVFCPAKKPAPAPRAVEVVEEDIEGEAMVSCCVCDLKLGEKVCSMKKANQCITTAVFCPAKKPAPAPRAVETVEEDAEADAMVSCCVCDLKLNEKVCSMKKASQCITTAVFCPAKKPAPAPRAVETVEEDAEADAMVSCCVCDLKLNEKVCSMKKASQCITTAVFCPAKKPAPAPRAEDMEGEAMVSCCVCDLKLGEKVCSMKKANQCITTAVFCPAKKSAPAPSPKKDADAMISCCVCNLKLGRDVCSMKKASECIRTTVMCPNKRSAPAPRAEKAADAMISCCVCDLKLGRNVCTMKKASECIRTTVMCPN